jgi:hypothetical protein
MSLGENVWEQVSSRQWKGRGIDGGVSPRTGTSEWITLTHRTGLDRIDLGGGVFAPACFEGCGSWWDQERDPGAGFMDGDWPGSLSLGQHTGDGKFDGKTFLGRTWMFFLGGGGGGEEEASGAVLLSRFRRTTLAFKQTHFLCYILYSEKWRFRYCMFQVISQSVLDLDDLDRRMCCSGFDNPSTCSTHWRQWRDWCTSFHHGLHGSVGMVFYTLYTCGSLVYVVICYMSIICYMSVICLVLGPSSGISDSVRIYRRVIFGNQNWWYVRTPCVELCVWCIRFR